MLCKASSSTMIMLLAAVGALPSVSHGQLKNLTTHTTANFRLRFEKNISTDEIGKLGRLLETACSEYRGRFGLSPRGKVDVFAFGSAGRYRAQSHSNAFDDAVIRDGKIFLDVRAVSKSDTAERNPIARVVSESILDELKWCPRWLIEVYGICAGKDLNRFGPPAQLTVSTFSDLNEDYSRAEGVSDVKEVYAKLAATARFFLDRYGLKKIEQLYPLFRRGPRLEEAFESAFGEKMPVIEKAWEAYLRSPTKG